MRRISGFLLTKSSSQDKNEGSVMLTHGTWCHVGHACWVSYLSVCAERSSSTAVCCTVRTVLSGALMDEDITCE